MDEVMELIGKYEISGKVGSGAFGHVYRARDPGVGRQVAIKMLDYSGDQHAIERFRAEASTTAKLVHRNIVTIYDYGDHEGNPFIVMELLEGETLATTISRLEDGSLELSLLSRLEILIQVAEGLEYAHQRSIVHRDIKPANLVCLPDGVVKILDFGIARLLGEATSRMTKVGETAGTVLYMAPEQFRGLDADVMTDLFAFGTICYELLTLVHPFAASDTAAIIYRVTTVDPDPLTEQIPDCPVRLDAILRRAIDKNRKVRYQSAGDIALDLKEIIVELSTGEAARLFAMAKIAASENRPDDARVLGRRALELDPVNAEIRKFRDDIREQLQSLAMQAETTEVLGRADGFLSSRKYNEAIEVLENAARSGHDDTRVTALLSEARRR
ncbi:MAG: serine/threonine protein kinase [Bryobacteraceae bacterium]|nr:serine/threonine protein kinase [Bryobacteraceae bacterium]